MTEACRFRRQDTPAVETALPRFLEARFPARRRHGAFVALEVGPAVASGTGLGRPA